MSLSAFATTCCASSFVASQVTKVWAAFWCFDFTLTASP